MRYEFTGLQAATLKIMLADKGFEYQRRWYIDESRVRHITKARQCGADWYFSLEGLINAIETGQNQYFFAPTSDQASAHFRNYIVAFSALAGVNIPVENLSHCIQDDGALLEQEASPILLSNGAELHFLSPESIAAGACGNVYLSEYAWSPFPKRLFAMARGISCHTNHRMTAYTSPSESDEAYAIWSKELPENKQRLSAKEAIRQGCTLFNLTELQSEFSVDDFESLFSAVWPQEKKEVIE